MDSFPDSFSQTIGPWVRGEGRRYPPPLGISVPYHLEDGTIATIYLYNGGYDAILPGVNSPQVYEQFEQAKADVFAAKEQGVWEAVRHLHDEVVPLGTGGEAIEAFRATFTITDSEGCARFSQLFVTAIPGLLVKVRLSYSEEGDGDWQNAVTLLLTWLSELLRALEAAESEDLSEFGPVHYVRLQPEQLLDPPGTEINSIGMKLVPIPSGEFLMGGRPDEEGYAPEEEHLHRVRITHPFFLGMFQVTQAEYVTLMEDNPSVFHGKTRPVEHVTWKQADQFCRRLSRLPAEQAAGRTYRLPTEAEWEYVCRAGSTKAYSFGDELTKTQANYCNTWVAQPQPTYPVGMFPPNAFALFDMHGNVWEWCADWFSPGYYAESPTDDPMGPCSGSHHVLRGGSASVEAHECRAATRGESASDGPDPQGQDRFAVLGDFGLRVVCEMQRK